MRRNASGSVSSAPFRSNAEIAIHVPDLARAEAFYGGVLGATLAARDADQLAFDTGALRLYVNRDPVALRSYVPSFDVRDFATARRHLTDAGCAEVRVGPDPSALYFRDPFGFVFDIIQRP